MKKTLMAVFLCLHFLWAQGQVNTYVVISDQSEILSYSSGIPIFANSDLNDAFSAFGVTKFRKTYPLSGYDYLQHVYQITSDSTGIGAELYGIDSLLFPLFEEMHDEFLTANPPNDWALPTNDTAHLHLINARKAWNYSLGDTGIVIGVTDTHIDVNHEDLIGQFARVGTNIPGSDVAHGTYVAGLIAAKTHNNKGVASIGYNCRLNIDSRRFDDGVMLAMAVDSSAVKTRVLNASWVNSTLDSFNFIIPKGNQRMDFAQGAYNEIYEHGVSVVAGAGNGRNASDTGGKAWRFYYPASYDHNLSITTVGHHLNSGSWNVEHVHELHVGDSVNDCHQHNTRVDLSAPGYFISSTYYSLSSPDKYKFRYSSGTSFSAPLVSGTIGLMYAKMKWLTPYQIEYILKKSSKEIYSIPANQKYAHGPTRHTGRLGSGTLDAGKALEMLNTDRFFTDYPDARTFRIKGITINHKCRPGARPGMPKPRIEVHMENGTPPYTYKWDQLIVGSPQANGVIVTPMVNRAGTNSISATIDSVWGPGVFYYRLSVYDNSEIQKVASKVFYMRLINDTSKWDLAMQDSYADLMEEPNEQLKRSPLDWDIWSSHDVWNRMNPDGDTLHQDPIANLGPNHMHVRVRNVGCKVSPSSIDQAALEMYWTVAATGETWDVDWRGLSTPINGQPPGGIITPNGGIAIPAIPPGGSTILTHSWTPPNPTAYDTSGKLTRIDICALARILGSQISPFGMTFPEVDTSKANVTNNNNIVTRNFVSLNPSIGIPSPPTTGVIIRNPSGGGTGGGGGTPPTPPKGSGSFTVQMATQNHLAPFVHGNLSNYLEVKMNLGGLFDKWSAGGMLGNVTAYDDVQKTVTWNLEDPLRLDNITLDENEGYYVIIEFQMKSGLSSIPYEIENQLIHLRLITPQQVDIDNGDGTSFQVTRDYVHSAVNYNINISTEPYGLKSGSPAKIGEVESTKLSLFEVYPNPADQALTLRISENTNEVHQYSIVDALGRVVAADRKAKFNHGKYVVNTSNLAAGTYYISLTKPNGNTEVKQFVKIDK